MSGMKSCPFCGKEDLYFEQDEEGETNIVCDWCEYKTRIFQTIGDAARWWNTRPIEDNLRNSIAELETKIRHNALWQASVDAEERAHLEKLVPDLKKRIAELEERLELCESALTSMVYQFFYSSESGALVHSFMSAEEEACEYLIKYGIAHWSNERKNSIVFDEVQE
jgi:Lar family restriction alleviation protein